MVGTSTRDLVVGLAALRSSGATPKAPRIVPASLALLVLLGPTACMRVGFRAGPDGATDITVPGTYLLVAPREFVMGSPPTELCRGDVEIAHQVTLTRAFWLSRTETAQAEFEIVMGYNPARLAACGPDCPVETVTWDEAVAYCNALSRRAGLTPCYSCSGSTPAVSCGVDARWVGAIQACPGYRLPVEAEWERAYRGASITAYYDGANASCTSDLNAAQIGWYALNAAGTTQPVAWKTPNSLGLHDLAGNVWEWVHDGFQPNLGAGAVIDPVVPPDGAPRGVRGGGHRATAAELRAAARAARPRDVRADDLGFRCARTKTP